VSKSQLNRADVNIITIGDNNVKFPFMLHKSIFRITLRNTDFPDGYREIVLLLCISMLPAILSSVLTRIGLAGRLFDRHPSNSCCIYYGSRREKLFPQDTNTSTLILFLNDFAFAHATVCSCIRLLA
jgi:hypothetical protein